MARNRPIPWESSTAATGCFLLRKGQFGSLIALSAVIGDLIASVLKRLAGMKDSGGTIPGIGGLLDLTDSLILAAQPVTSSCSSSSREPTQEVRPVGRNRIDRREHAPVYCGNTGQARACRNLPQDNKRASLLKLPDEFSVPYACLEQPPEAGISFPDGTELLHGQEGIETLAALSDAEIVVVAVVGAAGLLPTLSAAKAGKNIVLANKEALVVAGELVKRAASQHGATLIPADSEHNAVFQCLQGQVENSLDSIILTASGGPFRDLPIEEI